MNDSARHSKDYLYYSLSKDEDSIRRHREYFEDISPQKLLLNLQTDTVKKTVFVNIYNAVSSHSMGERTDSLFSVRRQLAFMKPQLRIAGKMTSLHGIEHRLLRRGQLPYISRNIQIPAFRSWFSRFQVSEVDFRIHFLLNCGTEACPRIRILRPDEYETQADTATQDYLELTTDITDNSIFVTPLLKWYRADFPPIKDLLTDYGFSESIFQSREIQYKDEGE